ncbi:MAG: amidohydrolase [Pseudomonadota bacterium]
MTGTNDYLVVKNATIITLDDANTIRERADVLVANGVIQAVGPDLVGDRPSDVRSIDARGMLLVPGLVNAHTHSPLAMAHGGLDKMNHRAGMWQIQGYSANRTAREVYVSTLLNCLEMITTGTTSVVDHFPEQAFTDEHVDAVVQAYEDCGMRAMVALRIFDGEYTDIFPPAGEFPDEFIARMRALSTLSPTPIPELERLCERAIKAHHGRAGGRIQIAPAPSNPMRCTDAMLEMTRDVAERHDTAIHCHLLETEIQSVIAQERYGCTILQHMDRLGLLSERLSCAHTIWIDAEDIPLMAERSTVVVHNPESNCRGGSGIAPTPKMLEKGVPVAIGNDGSSSGGQQILQRAMRLATFLHREPETDPRTWIGNHDAFAMGTIHGAAALRMKDKIGRIAPGHAGDLVLYDLNHPWWIPLRDPIGQLVASETGRSVDTVIIDGRIVVESGQIATFDSRAVINELRDATPRMRARNSQLFDLAGRLSQEALI